MKPVFAALLGAVLIVPSVSFPSLLHAQESPLTLQDALSIARARAAQVLAATGRVEEARARLFPAGRRFRDNPVVELGGGRRQAERTFTDYELAVSQGFEPGARRRARVAGAQAAVEAAEAGLEDTRRVYLGEAVSAFFRTVAAQERSRLSAETVRLTADLLKTIERRYEMGEITALDLNRARIAAARAQAEQSAAEGERLGRTGDLRALLGLDPGEGLSLTGALRELPAYELETLLARTAERADLQALAAETREAEAQALLGEALARPDFALRTGYQREEGADVVSAGVAISLPLFQRGQEEIAVGRARAASLRTQLEARKRAGQAEVRAAFEAYRRRVQAVEELERTALPAIEDNQALAQRSFEVGEINLGDLLLIRREILETRLFHLDLTLEARLAAVELETRAGVSR
jgi:outer membrane protein, heavy metal efflux system